MDTLIGNFDTLNEKVKRIARSNTETKALAQKVKENTKEKNLLLIKSTTEEKLGEIREKRN